MQERKLKHTESCYGQKFQVLAVCVPNGFIVKHDDIKYHWHDFVSERRITFTSRIDLCNKKAQTHYIKSQWTVIVVNAGL